MNFMIVASIANAYTTQSDTAGLRLPFTAPSPLFLPPR
jgi:hypothetical protein